MKDSLNVIDNIKLPYFAYGSNLNGKDWNSFISRNNLKSDSIIARPGIFFLPDHELNFSAYSSTRKGGVLDVVEKIGHAVVGKLYDVNDGYEALDKKEGNPNFYHKKSITVLDQNGNSVKAITYVIKKFETEFVKPSGNYLDLVIEGYEQHGIVAKYPWALEQVLQASNGQISNTGVPFVFVYGTLRQGQSRFEKIKSLTDEIIPDQKIPGAIIHLGDYPGLISYSGFVTGEIIYCKNMQNLLEKLDYIEGFSGYDRDSLFTRILLNSGKITCWVYLWNGEISDGNIIPSGDWTDTE